MRKIQEKLSDLVKKSVILKYRLPNIENSIKCSFLSKKENDYCFMNESPEDISTVIYNGIVDFAKNEFEIDYSNLEKEQLQVLKLYLRYEETAAKKTKKSYGFYGEVLLDLILRVHIKTDVLIAKGHFYDPLSKSEMKGYDVFHIIENENNVELWFGESKFYVDYKKAITNIFESFTKTFTDEYFNQNLFAIMTKENDWGKMPKKLRAVIEKWKDNPEINLAEEVAENNMKLIYPMFIVYDKKGKDYTSSIKDCIEYLESYKDKIEIVMGSFEVILFFIFLPVEEVKKIKEDVIEWITEKKPLI